MWRSAQRPMRTSFLIGAGHAAHRRLEPAAPDWVSLDPDWHPGGDARHQALLAMARRQPDQLLAEL